MKMKIWIVYGDYDFQGGFSLVFYDRASAFAQVAESLGVDSFDGRFDGTPAGEAYESGKWKCLECEEHEIELLDAEKAASAIHKVAGDHFIAEVIDRLLDVRDKADDLDADEVTAAANLFAFLAKAYPDAMQMVQFAGRCRRTTIKGE